MENKSKIFVIYHQPGEALNSDVFQSIAVGENKNEFSKDFLRDDIGENIADKNSKYNELTAIYWVFKHIDKFKDVEYFGFSHYRRLFCFDGLDKTAYVRKNICKSLINVDNEKLERIFSDYDFVAPRPSHYRSVRKHYEKSHNKEDLSTLLGAIKEVVPDFYKSASEYLDGSEEYLYNMFIFKKSDFIDYCNFIFKTLEEYNNKTPNDKRLYVSERLTGIFIYHLIESGKTALYLPILHIRSKSLKIANKQVQKNFKEKANRGFIYKIKPLILCLLPRHIEQWFRRRKTR